MIIDAMIIVAKAILIIAIIAWIVQGASMARDWYLRHK